jgi:hypothetical protein
LDVSPRGSPYIFSPNVLKDRTVHFRVILGNRSTEEVIVAHGSPGIVRVASLRHGEQILKAVPKPVDYLELPPTSLARLPAGSSLELEVSLPLTDTESRAWTYVAPSPGTYFITLEYAYYAADEAFHGVLLAPEVAFELESERRAHCSSTADTMPSGTALPSVAAALLLTIAMGARRPSRQAGGPG